MTYPDGQGGMVVEEVSKIGLIERAYQLGWTVSTEGSRSVDFDEAISWEDDFDQANRVSGMWFAHQDCVEWSTMCYGAPLTTPGNRRQQFVSEYQAHLEELHLEQDRAKAKRAAELAEEIRRGNEYLVEVRIALRARQGVAISKEIEQQHALFRGIGERIVLGDRLFCTYGTGSQTCSIQTIPTAGSGISYCA